MSGPRVHSSADNDEDVIHSWLNGMGSANTRANFEGTARRFIALLAGEGRTLRTAQVSDVRRALKRLMAGRSSGTARQYAKRVNSLLSHAHRLAYVEASSVGGLDLCGTREEARRSAPVPSETEIKALIRAAGTPRDRLLIMLAYAGGLRMSELTALKWCDITWLEDGRAQVAVQGRVGRQRSITLPSSMARRLRKSLGDATATSAPLFPSTQTANALGPRAVHQVLKKTAARAGMTAGISLECLRRAHVRHAVQRGQAIVDVQGRLGHATSAWTAKYARSSLDDIE